MEDTLGDIKELERTESTDVLILVLMEDTLGEFKITDFEEINKS